MQVLEVGAQEMAAVGQPGPFAVLVFVFDGDCQPFAALVVRVAAFADVDLEEAGGTGVLLEEAAHAAFGGAAVTEGTGARMDAPPRAFAVRPRA